MSVTRYRLPDDAVAHAHPEGEMVLTADHEREMARVRGLLEKQALQARGWKAEVERLQEDAQAHAVDVDYVLSRLRAERDEARAEVERLRAALREIASNTLPEGLTEDISYEAAASVAYKIATAALQE